MKYMLGCAIFILLALILVGSSYQQSSISLNNAQWTVRNSNNSILVPAHVPGGIYSDLRRNNVLKEDILFDKNDIAYRWVGHESWTYVTSFKIDQRIAQSKWIHLTLNGVDTVSSIFLNGHKIGATDNMFVRYVFDIKPYLKSAGIENNLVIKFESPIKYAERKSRLSIRNNRGKIIPPYCPSPAQKGECHVNFIRKMQASFSWDWGPAFPSVGLYKDVSIEFGSFGMIRDILVETKLVPPSEIASIDKRNALLPPDQLAEDDWLLKTKLVTEMFQPSIGYNMTIEYNLDGTLLHTSEHINEFANSDATLRLHCDIRINSSQIKVEPWWPNNAGHQKLYKLSVRMIPKNEKSAEPSSDIVEKEIHFGFRTVELIQEPLNKGNLEEGIGFNFRINGMDLFAMGSNWIPSNILPEYSNDYDSIRYLLQSAKDANMNMLRVWGGGMYESDEFYRLADEMGIMIWHDFMFACALYPTEEEFLSSVRIEIEQQVQRLQHHPSIVLWAGNNENEMAIAGPWWPETLIWNRNLRESYEQLYFNTIRPIVENLDRSRPYLESSPSNGILSRGQPYTIARKPNDNRYGDVHHYNYMSDSFDWSSFPSTRFASEYGYQSYPSFDSLASISKPNNLRYPLSSNILHRQHRLTGELEMRLQIKMHFNDLDSGGIDELKNFLYVSQLTQAIAIKTETEFYRRNRFIDTDTKLGHTMGALYWQLNDVWQAPTWSSIEYGGKWKILHHFAKRFFSPIQLIPYIVDSSRSSRSNNVMYQLYAAGTTLLSSSPNRHQKRRSVNPQQELHNLQQRPLAPGITDQSLVIDLVRDDQYRSIEPFQITIKFYHWLSFSPVWQNTIHVDDTKRHNVTQIYKQELSRIVEQSGGAISLSSGVFRIMIEQNPGTLQSIENYLLPVIPSKITAIGVPKIGAKLIEGPFELNEASLLGDSTSSQWSCAYRIHLATDSIAMFVWLDMNLFSPRNSTSKKEYNSPPFNIRSQIDENFIDQSKTTTDSQSETLNHYKPLENTGSDMMRYQFSDNAFNMFEPSKMIELYLNKCLKKSQIEAALEIKSLADCL